MSLNKRLCSLEAKFEKLKRKQRKGKVEVENEVSEKEDPNEEIQWAYKGGIGEVNRGCY